MPCAALCACSSPQKESNDPQEASTQPQSTLQWKLESHEAHVIDRIQEFRKTNRQEFATFMKAFGV
jgi:hypothetical protein